MVVSQRHRPRGRRYAGVLAALTAGAVAVGVPVVATAEPVPGAPAVTATPAKAGAARTVTLVTGQQITVVTNGTGLPSYQVRPSGAGDDGVVTLRLGSDDHYVVPIDALPYLGRGLDRSLFDVTALTEDAGPDGTPVTLAFAAGTAPKAPPGVTLTSVQGSTAQGRLAPDAGARFVSALRAQIGADVAAGRPPGSTPLVDGLKAMSVTGSASGTAAPHYPMHTLQITATDALGAPATATGVVLNNDAMSREAASVPLEDGLGRVAVPAGDYTVGALLPTFDDQGSLTEVRLVTTMDVTVPDSGATTEVALDARTATSVVHTDTPRPSVSDVTAIDLERVDATGQAAAQIGVGEWGQAPVMVAPAPAPTVGRLQTRARFDMVATDAADNYRYDLAFSADHIDADQSYSADPRQLATVRHHFSQDPAGDPQGSLLGGPFDPAALTSGDEFAGYSDMPVPGGLTEYVQTYPGSLWGESFYAFPFGLSAEPRSFTGGRTYDVDWAHGPLAPTLGHSTAGRMDFRECLMCVAGTVAGLAYSPIGDGSPDHFGDPTGTAHATVYVNGRQVADVDDFGSVLTGVPAGAATYRLVLTTDTADDPYVSQSTHTVTDLTVKSPAVPDPNSVLTSDRPCQGSGTGTPCLVLPALNLAYDLATDSTNTSTSPLQRMGLTVDHVSYDGKGSTAPITSVAVRVSFDGGANWRSATVSGTGGHYQAQWANLAPATNSVPTLQVTATDALGGSVTQTITHAYDIAPAASAAR